MTFAFGKNCSCGASIVARTIVPELVVTVGRERGLVVTETCAVGHVAEFSVESITMTDLADFPIGESGPNRDLTQVEMARLLWENEA